MRCLAAIASLIISFQVKAQMPTEIFFQPGAELEYKTYIVKPLSNKLQEVTRLTLIVNRVKDSNNVYYSFVTKRGAGIKYPDVSFEKNYIISKSSEGLSIPQDLYSIDTVYAFDITGGKKSRDTYTTVAFKGKNRFLISITGDSKKMVSDPKTVEMVASTKMMNMSSQEANYGHVYDKSYTIKSTLKELEFGEKASSTTAAGSFEAYKLTVATTLDVMGTKIDAQAVIYYSTEYGFLRHESIQAKQQAGYVELVRIKK